MSSEGRGQKVRGPLLARVPGPETMAARHGPCPGAETDRQRVRGGLNKKMPLLPYYTELLTLSLKPILALISVFCDLSVSVRVTWPPAPPVTHCAINLAGGAF